MTSPKDSGGLFDATPAEPLEPIGRAPGLAERDRILRRLQLPTVCTPRGSVDGCLLLAVLRKLASHCGGDVWWPVTLAEIARHVGRSAGHVQRAVHALRQLGVIRVRRMRTRASGGRTCNHYRLHWPRVAEWADGDDVSPVTLHPPMTRVTRDTSVGVTHDTSVGVTHDTSFRAHFERTNEPPPSLPPGDLSRQEEEVLNLGVEQPACVRKAAAAGLTAGQIAEIIEHYREHHAAAGWGPAALYARLASAHPAQVATIGWPKPAKRGRGQCPNCGTEKPDGGFDRVASDGRELLRCSHCKHTWQVRRSFEVSQ